jgi:hypothetical protein
MKSYSFLTSAYSGKITPITPINEERLVPLDTPVIIDFIDGPSSVYVNNVTVYSGGSGQNGWTGTLITYDEGKRLILISPSDFISGSVNFIRVRSTEDDTLEYVFQAATYRLTSTYDAGSPKIVETNISNIWIGYSRNNELQGSLPADFYPGNIYLRKINPTTAETLVVPGTVVDIGYDSTLNKVIIYYVRNGRVFAVEADPGDLPTTLSQPRHLKSDVRTPAYGDSKNLGYSITEYPFLDKMIPQTVNFKANYGDSRNLSFNLSPYNATPTPVILGGYLTDTQVIIRIPRVTSGEEANLLIGYVIVKYSGGTPNEIGYIDISSGDAFVDFYDVAFTSETRYAVMCVYKTYSRSIETTKSLPGSKASVPMIGQVVGFDGTYGNYKGINFSSTEYPFLDKLVPDYPEISTYGDYKGLYWALQGFDPIGS